MTNHPTIDAKRLASLQARLAFRGVELVPLVGGGFVAKRFGLLRELPTLDAAEVFAATMPAIRAARGVAL
jgi:hypothetical protein